MESGVVRAVPTGYTRATLDVFQPIQYVNPGDWTGYELTDDSIFSNPVHPMAQATYADAPLIWPDKSMPPYWEGLYELRMVFSAVNKQPYDFTYPTAVIRVTGNTWTLVQGGGSSCTDGSAVSVATYLLPKSDTAKPKPPAKVGDRTSKGAPAAPSTTQAAGGSSTTTTIGASSRSASADPRGPGSDGGGSSVAEIVGGAVAALLVGGTASLLVFRRRRRVA